MPYADPKIRRLKGLEYARRWKARNPGHRQITTENRRQRQCGITPAQFQELFRAQAGTCAICREPIKGQDWNHAACVDHCHSTGKIRGLLCRRCNFGIGIFRDSPEKLKAAFSYLTNFLS